MEQVLSEITATDQFIMGLLAFFYWAKWLMAAAGALTVADLFFGIAAARRRGERVKRSRAIRRTIDKICGYVLWIVLAYAFGQAFGRPFDLEILPTIILIVIYGVELESIYTNYFESRGMKVSVGVLDFFRKQGRILDVEKVEKKEDKNESGGR